MRAHPDAFAFQNGLDESDIAAGCACLAGPSFQIWGLDQEFLGAAGYLFEQMLTARPGPGAGAAIERLAAADRTATTKAMATGSAGDLFIHTVDDRQLDEAGSAIRLDGDERVTALFNALIETRAIYLGQNRRLRVQQAAGPPDEAPPARVLFEFGDVHMAKGVNSLGQRDVGNFVAERAEGEGVSSLHIAA